MSGDFLVSAVTAVCVLALAVLSRWFLTAPISFVLQFAPVWVYIVYVLSAGRRRSSGEINRDSKVWSATIVLVTMAVAVVSAI
jgi:hypothetical protein